MAVIELLQLAEQNDYSYYHILSANTFPIVSFDELNRFFLNNQHNYMEYRTATNDMEALRRQKYFFLPDVLDCRNKRLMKIQGLIRRLQDVTKTYRKIIFTEKGYFYCHITHPFVEFLLEYFKKNRKLKYRLMTTFIPEEFFFQHLLKLSPYCDTLISDCLIYSDWSQGMASPKELNETDIIIGRQKGMIFARKIRSIELATKLTTSSKVD